jgi:hypothetical protein
VLYNTMEFSALYNDDQVTIIILFYMSYFSLSSISTTSLGGTCPALYPFEVT